MRFVFVSSTKAVILKEISQIQKWEIMKNKCVLAVYYNPFDKGTTIVDFNPKSLDSIKTSLASVKASIEKALEMEELFTETKYRTPPDCIAGKAEILGDIVSPIIDEEDWGCLN